MKLVVGGPAINSWPRLLRLAFLTSAVLVLPLLLPGAARAACGDHVRLPGHDHPAPADRCTGPFCTQGKPPLTPPPTTQPASEDLRALPVLGVPATGGPPSSRLGQDQTGRPIHRSSPPDPPPRALLPTCR